MFNGDSRPDLAVAVRNPNIVSVLLNAANGNFTGQTRAVDTIAPRVVSIVPDPSQPATNVANPRFIVTFSESVTGVNPADFVAVAGAGVTVAPGPVVVTGSGTTYAVTVNGVSGTGTLGSTSSTTVRSSMRAETFSSVTATGHSRRPKTSP